MPRTKYVHTNKLHDGDILAFVIDGQNEMLLERNQVPPRYREANYGTKKCDCRPVFGREHA